MSRCKACNDTFSEAELRRKTETELCATCASVATAAADGVFIEPSWTEAVRVVHSDSD